MPVYRRLFCGWNLPVGYQPAEMIEPEDIKQFQVVTDPFEPPVKLLFF